MKLEWSVVYFFFTSKIQLPFRYFAGIESFKAHFVFEARAMFDHINSRVPENQTFWWGQYVLGIIFLQTIVL